MHDEVDARGLFVRDALEASDIALVFGHAEPVLSASRARHAAALYHRGLAPRLLLSGGTVSSAVSEAEQMSAVCVDAGVPRESLLLERESRNTFENAARSVRLLEAEGLLGGVRTVLLVSCPWHMRRAYLTARRAFPEGARLLCAPHQEGCSESTWRESSDCVLRVVKELAVLERFTRAGLLSAPPPRPGRSLQQRPA